MESLNYTQNLYVIKPIYPHSCPASSLGKALASRPKGFEHLRTGKSDVFFCTGDRKCYVLYKFKIVVT